MNYMYQLHGVQMDDAKALLGISEGPPPDPVFENALSDGVFNHLAGTPYRLGFYAPRRSSNVDFGEGGDETL